MLRVHQITSAKAAKRYYAQGGDYYGQELVGQWGGKGAALLGLAGRVDRRAFDSLCDNLHPSTGARLTGRTRDDRTVGYDFNFNAPKGVSLLYGLTQDPEILEAMRSAVQETMADVEAEMKARVRKGKRNEERVVGNLVSAEFVHFTSRPIDQICDPSLHAHIVVFNTVSDPVERGAWKAGYFRDVKRDAPYFEALFHNRFAGKLTDLGYAVERRGKDWDLAAAARPLVQKFSRRTQQIEKLAEELGIVDPDAKAKLGATSREHKANHLTTEELQEGWRQRLNKAEAVALQAAADKKVPVKAPARDADEKALRQAALHLFERQSAVPYRELLARALRLGPGEVTLDGLQRAGKRLGLILEEMDGRMMVTVPEAVANERRIIDFGKKSRGTRSRLGIRGREFVRDWLGKDQKAAVQHALTSTDQVILIEGRAGVGKTTLAEEIVDGIQENGKSVVAVAPSAQAGRGTLRQAFKDADTLQRLLVDPAMQEAARGNVIMVDEAGFVGVPTMVRLFDLAEQLNSRIILIFDRNQHRSPGERGLPIELLADKARLPVARVDDIRRQRDVYRDAVKLLSDRRAAEGFDRLDQMKWIEEAKPDQIYQKAAAAYVQAFDECAGDVAAISPTHADVDRFTDAIRRELAAKGRLGEANTFQIWKPAHLTEAERGDVQSYEPGMLVKFHKAAPGFKAGARLVLDEPAAVPAELAARFSVYRPAVMELAAGDRIRITANGKSMDGHRLDNGTVYNVAGFTPQGHIRLDNGWTIDKHWGHIAAGWVTTSHSSQSRTVRRAVVVQSSLSLPASTAEQMYVSASRAKEHTLFLTDSKEELRRAIQREEKRISATDLLDHRKERRIRLMKNLFRLRRYAASLRPRAATLVPEQQRELAYERA